MRRTFTAALLTATALATGSGMASAETGGEVAASTGSTVVDSTRVGIESMFQGSGELTKGNLPSAAVLMLSGSALLPMGIICAAEQLTNPDACMVHSGPR